MREFELVLPCYNESNSLKSLITEAAEAALNFGHGPDQFQLIVVQNGSTDDSSQTLIELEASPLAPWFRTITIEINQGYGHGLWLGLKQANAKYIGWTHADQQCKPKDAFFALTQLKASPDPNTLIKGDRLHRNWKDRCVSRVFEFIAHTVLGIRSSEINAQPKVFPIELLNHVDNPPKDFAFDLYFLFSAEKQKYTIKSIPVLFPSRPHGISNWSYGFIRKYKTIVLMILYTFKLSIAEGRIKNRIKSQNESRTENRVKK